MKRILVGIDGSPRSQNVLDAAVELAPRLGAKLVLIRGVGIPPEMPHDFWRETRPLIDVLKDNAQTYLEKVAKTVPEGLLVATRVPIGSPWQVICEAAKQEDVDLVVIGSHGYSGLDRVLGTTAAKVVDHADRSVLVVRAAKRVDVANAG